VLERARERLAALPAKALVMIGAVIEELADPMVANDVQDELEQFVRSIAARYGRK
jgi:hypothetical protein